MSVQASGSSASVLTVPLDTLIADGQFPALPLVCFSSASVFDPVRVQENPVIPPAHCTLGLIGSLVFGV